MFDLACTLEELYSGTTKKMRVTRTGRGETVLEIKVQAGWGAGTKVTFKGEGDDMQDIVFVIKEAPHPRFVRVGSNLVAKVKVDLVDALCGYTLKLDLLDGTTLEAKMIEVLKPGMQVVFSGRGMPRSRGGAPGDLLVEFIVEFPKELSEAQKLRIKAALHEGEVAKL